MSGGMENISVSDCDFSQTKTGLDIKYSAVRGGYVKDIHFKNLIMGNTSGGALTVNSQYGSMNPSCPQKKVVPCPVENISFENITPPPLTDAVRAHLIVHLILLKLA